MTESISERCITIRSRQAEGYQWTAVSLKNLQHVLTDWFPRAVYYDLTDDTARVDVAVRKDFSSGKDIYSASFMRADDSVIKRAEYDEGKLIGKSCDHYEHKKTHYDGNKDGYDCRLVFYTVGHAIGASRPK